MLHLIDRYIENRRINRSIRALSALNDTILQDIGVARGDIPFVAQNRGMEPRARRHS